MERHTQRRERTGIAQIIGIGFVLAVALWGGLQLLAATRSSWEAREAQKAANAKAADRERQMEDFEKVARANALRSAMAQARAQETRRLFENGTLKCVGTVVFRKIPNGWENVPGGTCPTPLSD